MTKIWLHAPDETACTLHRVGLPLQHLEAPFKYLYGIELFAGRQPPQECDVAVLLKPTAPGWLPIVEKWKKQGVKVVLSTDDDLNTVEASNPFSDYLTPQRLEVYNAIRDMADHILVSTKELALATGLPNKAPFVCPNLIDVTDWKEEPVHDDPRTRILFAGGPSHADDLSMIVPVIEQIVAEREDVLFLFYGCWPKEMSEAVNIKYSTMSVRVPLEKYQRRVGFVEHTGLEGYVTTLKALAPDIGLAPLTDNQFNRCKSHLKYLEYSMVRAATIASDLPPYNETMVDGLHGLLAATPNDWYKHIIQLLDDKTDRDWFASLSHAEVEVSSSWQYGQELVGRWRTALKEFCL